MLTNQQIEDYANYDLSAENLDEWNGFLKGAHWANDQNSAEIAAKDAEIAELVKALRNALTEIDGAYRVNGWDALDECSAYSNGAELIKKYGK